MADADTNPWSVAGWNLTAQALYANKHGMARAEARARDAGSFVGAKGPVASTRRYLDANYTFQRVIEE